MSFPATPAIDLPIQEFGRHIDALDIVADFERPRDFDDGPSLAGRIRGAWGEALRMSEKRPDPKWAKRRELFGLPSGYDLFFGPHPKGKGWPSARARPFLITSFKQSGQIELRLRLFGSARAWQAEALAALENALSGGVTIAPLARSRARITAKWRLEHVFRPQPLVVEQDMVLHLLSPTAFERGKALAIEPAMIAGSLLSRIEGIAAWHGMTVRVDRTAIMQTWQHASPILEIDRLVAWQRMSSAQGGRLVDMCGAKGRLRLGALSADWRELLALAPLVHLGSHSTFGMGACRLTMESAASALIYSLRGPA